MNKCFSQRALLRVVRVVALSIPLALITHLTTFAQEDFKPKFGTIDRGSVEMTAYPGDSTADAVYLYDYGNVQFGYNEQKGVVMTMDTWVRVKILKESALSRASVLLRYYDGNNFEKSERIEDIKGFTYNLEGNQISTTALDRKAITSEKSADYYRTIKFNLPNVKKGSVIEYSYSRSTPINLKDNPSTWTFQGSVPFKWSEYRITVPHFLDYKMIMGGYLPLYINKSESVNVAMGSTRLNGPGTAYRFVVKDAPAFVNEPFITTELDYLSKIRFELSSIMVPGEITKHYSRSWSDVEKTLNDVSWFGGELRKSGYLKEVKDKISSETTDLEKRMTLAYSHLQSQMKWNGNDGVGSKEGARKAYENKTGNASDINLMLTILLRELDIESNPVLLSTRANGQILREIPLLENFNYVISHVKIGEKEYFLDATQPYAKPGMLPENALNGSGRLIPEKGSGRFIDIIPADAKAKFEMVQAEISPEAGTIKGKYSISYGGYEALSWRRKYMKEAETAFNEDLKKQVPDWQVQNISIKNKAEDLTGTVNITCDFEADDDNASPGILYFNPILAGRWSANPLKSKERIYPLDLTCAISTSYIGNFRLPEGYVLEDTPKPEVIMLPEKAGKFSFQVRQSGNVIQVNSTILVSKTRFMPDEYEDLQEFFERIVQKHSQPLIIKKKTN